MFSGVAIYMGPLKGCMVFADTNDNGAFDAGEPTTITGSYGGYSLEVEAGGVFPNFRIIPSAGCVDRYTGKNLSVPLSAPADCPILSALTNIKVAIDDDVNASVSSEDAIQQALGLSDAAVAALNWSTCTFNPLETIWSGTDGEEAQLLKDVIKLQLRIIAVAGQIAVVVGFASDDARATAAHAVMEEVALQIKAADTAPGRRQLALDAFNTAQMVTVAGEAAQGTLSAGVAGRLAAMAAVASEFALDQADVALAETDATEVLTNLAKVAAVAQTEDESVAAVLSMAKESGFINSTALESALIVAATKESLMAALDAVAIPDDGIVEAPSPLPPPQMPSPPVPPPPLSSPSSPRPPPLENASDPLQSGENNGNAALAALVLLVLLLPCGCLAYAYISFGSNWKLYLAYRLSHSNPKRAFLYMPKDARDGLRRELFHRDKANSESGELVHQKKSDIDPPLTV